LAAAPARAIVAAMDWLRPHYRRIEKRLRRLLGRRGRSREDAEDLIQEALLRLHQYCRRGEVRDAEAFLVRTVRNLSIDRHRRDHRHLYARQTVEEIDLEDALEDGAPPPDEIFAARERLYRIGRTLEAVSARTRDIYFAHRAGYSYAEIEARMGVSKSTVEKHIARAVLALMDVKELE
jgi:RNA polymerase sigma factor (sigma-70 family)